MGPNVRLLCLWHSASTTPDQIKDSSSHKLFICNNLFNVAGGQNHYTWKNCGQFSKHEHISVQKGNRQADYLVSGLVQQLSMFVFAADEDLDEAGGGGARGKHEQDGLLEAKATLRDATPQQKTGFFGNFSKILEPPPSPLLGTPASKKNSMVYFAF